MAQNKSALTLDDLLDAQRKMAQNTELSDAQRKHNEEQIKKLEDIKKQEIIGNLESVKEDADINRITKPKGDSKHVGLGDVRTEVKGLRQDLQTFTGGQPKEGRSALPKWVSTAAGTAGMSAQTADGESQADRTNRLNKIGDIIEKKTEAARGGSRNETLNERNKSTFDQFVKESAKRDELLKTANDEQQKIFERIEETMIKLREAGTEDSKKLRAELAGLSGELSQTADTEAKQKIGGVLNNAQSTAATGTRGNQGTLGDAWAAATGKKTVLKEGFSYDTRGTGSQIRDEKGKFSSAKTAGMGRLSGAASILGSFIGGKAEQYVEGQRSEKFQSFADNFRASSTAPEGKSKAPVASGRLEGIANLQGQQDALTGKASITPQAKPASIAITGKSAGTATMAKTAASTINITGKTVNIAGWKPQAANASKSAIIPDATPGTASATPAAAAMAAAPAAAASAAPAAAEGGSVIGDIASSALDLGKSGASKIGSMASSAWGAGKNLIGKIPGGALKGGIAALGGAALSYGGDKLKELGHEKLGGAADVAGTAASWGGTGAMLGSVVPGVGTAIGAGVGAVAGGAYGLYKNWGNFFGGDKKAGGASAGSDPDGTLRMGVEGQRNEPMNQARAAAAMAQQNSVGQLSARNADMKTASPTVVVQQPAAPTPQAGGGSGGASQMALPRGNVRPDESAMERYSNRNAHYW